MIKSTKSGEQEDNINHNLTDFSSSSSSFSFSHIVIVMYRFLIYLMFTKVYTTFASVRKPNDLSTD
jgi:hypothetical protein